jgi:hypothetical protein
MKTTAIFVVALCASTWIGTAGEIILKSGGKISGELAGVTPATARFKTQSGVVTVLVSDLAFEETLKLPESVSQPYSVSDQLIKTFKKTTGEYDVIVSQLKAICEKNTRTVSTLSDLAKKSWEEGYEYAKKERLGGVPTSIHDQILRKAQTEWPGDYHLQEVVVKEQEMAWLNLQR